jgi:arylsulfatase A-like enzyme/tetratricopeptide (TPR) repeat protein
VRERLFRLAPALLFLAGCRPEAPPSLLLVTLDTVRADRLGSYGSSLGLTPRLDELASESVRFEDVTCQTPLTTPSHASILTGLLPQRHGIRNNESFRLADSTATLATVLRASGYETAAFVGAFPLESRFGLDRGFDLYDDDFLRGSRSQERSAGDVLAAARGFIKERLSSGRPFFVWIHLFDAHSPYEAPAPFRERFPGDAYGAEIAYLDDALGSFIDGLPLDDVVISVVADHGEALGEHGESTHGALLYESTLRVPWMIRLPRARLGGVEVEAPVRTIDVAPTLLGLLNASPLDGVDGVDLSPFLEKGSVPDLPVPSESLYLHLLLGWNELRSLRRGSLKVIGPSHPELYDLTRDPGEATNRIEERQSEARRLLTELRGSVRETSPSAAAEGERTAERLASLGYVSGATRTRRDGRDPRDGIAIWHEIESGTSLLLRDRPSARTHFERALALDPENGLVLKSLGDIALAEGRAAPALELYGKAEANGFEHPDLDLGLARALAALGEIDEAHEQVERFLAARPDSGDGLLLRGRLLRARGRTAEAEAELRRALEAMPGDASALNELGSVLAEEGRRDDARGLFEQAMAAGPEAPEPRRNLALLLEGSEAERLRREAIQLDPEYAEARIDLSRQLAESGRAAEAETEIEAALRLRPDDPEALFIAARVAELLGRPEQARRYYEHFLSVAPPELTEPREIARRRLGELGRP